MSYIYSIIAVGYFVSVLCELYTIENGVCYFGVQTVHVVLES